MLIRENKNRESYEVKEVFLLFPGGGQLVFWRLSPCLNVFSCIYKIPVYFYKNRITLFKNSWKIFHLLLLFGIFCSSILWLTYYFVQFTNKPHSWNCGTTWQRVYAKFQQNDILQYLALIPEHNNSYFSGGSSIWFYIYAAMTKLHRLGNVYVIEIHFSQFWRPGSPRTRY
jgi:hypothetical protein